MRRDRSSTPGLIDIQSTCASRAWLEKKRSSRTRAAAAGGFTTVVCMPNTSPGPDSPSTIAWIKERAAQAATRECFTDRRDLKNLAGEELAPIGSLAQAGVVAITDDGHCVQNNELDAPRGRIRAHVRPAGARSCQDYNLVGNGVVHEGYWSTLLGLPGLAGGGRGSDRRAQHSARGTLRSSHSLPAHQRGRQRAVLREARARGVKSAAKFVRITSP